MFLITLLFGNQVTMLDSPIICFLVRLLIVFCEYIRFIFLIPTFHNFLFIPKWKKNPPQFKISTGSTNSKNVHNYISPHSHYVIFLYLYKTHELYCTPSFFTVLSSLILFSSFFLHDSMSFWDSHTGSNTPQIFCPSYGSPTIFSYSLSLTPLSWQDTESHQSMTGVWILPISVSIYTNNFFSFNFLEKLNLYWNSPFIHYSNSFTNLEIIVGYRNWKMTFMNLLLGWISL